MGRFIDVFLDNNITEAQKKATPALASLFLIALIGGVAGLYILAKVKYPTIMNAVLLTGAELIILMAVSEWMILRKKYAAGLGAYMTCFLIFAFLSSYFLMPELGKYESSRHVTKRLLALAKPDEAIGAETQYRRGVAFYTDRENIPDIHKHHIMTTFFARNDRVWGIIKEKNYDFLYDDIERPFDRPTYVVYKLGKKVIVTNKKPLDGKFIRMRNKNVTR